MGSLAASRFGRGWGLAYNGPVSCRSAIEWTGPSRAVESKCLVDGTKLYLVGPVGEWHDLTLRARDLLRRAALIVVHDLDQACSYVQGMGIQARLLESGQERALQTILSTLDVGEVAWLVIRIEELQEASHRLLRELFDQGIDLISVPGGSPIAAGLVASGLPADRFTALGPLPALRTERSVLWLQVGDDPLTLVCEVGGEELDEVLCEMRAHLGDRRIAICQGDQVWRGPTSEGAALDWAGCVTLVIEGADAASDWPRERVLTEVRALLDAGTSLRDTAREVARRSGWARRQVYELALLASRDEP